MKLGRLPKRVLYKRRVLLSRVGAVDEDEEEDEDDDISARCITIAAVASARKIAIASDGKQ